MKTFEERYTAWLDLQLHGDELHAFERELAATHPEAFADRDEAHALCGLLRRHGGAPPMGNGDFFNTQLLERLERAERVAAPAARGRFAWPWALPHLAWGGICCLLVSFALFRTWVEPSQRATELITAQAAQRGGPVLKPARYGDYDLKAHSTDPGIYATPVHSRKEDVTVLWLDGMDYLPASYQLQ